MSGTPTSLVTLIQLKSVTHQLIRTCSGANQRSLEGLEVYLPENSEHVYLLMQDTCEYSHEEADKRAFKLMASKPQGDRLPFEKSKNRKKSAKNPAFTPATDQKAAPKESQLPDVTTKAMAVPDVVSKRMAKRMAVLCGVPSALGMLTFVVSYFVVSHGFKLPNIAVVLTSMGFLGLGVLGLSYGLLSASWDEEILGSLLGWQEFTTNWGRMTSAWRSARSQSD